MSTFLRSIPVLLALSGFATAQFTPAPSPLSPIPAGPSPVSIVAGNFNVDSYPDLAVVNRVTTQPNGTVTILLGNAIGGFTMGASLPVGMNPSSIVTADFNKDGYQDLAVTNQSDNTVSLLLGGANGVFLPMATFGIGAWGISPDFLAVGDFNKDGNPDLAITNRGSNNVTVLLGDGKGGFMPPLGPFPVGNSPSSVAVGDFNGDGYPDLAVTNELDNTVTLLLNNQSGGFSPATASPFLSGANPSFVSVADFNADGNLDLAIANLSSGNVTVLLGNGSGGFAAAPASPFAVGSEPDSIAVADFNGDGKPDLAIADFASNNVAVLLGNGSGGFSSGPGSPYAVLSEPSSIAVGDFSQNGKLDLAVANHGSDDITLLLNDFTTAASVVSAASYTAPVALGSIVSIFGFNSAVTAVPSSDVSLPTCLGGVSVTVTDFSGAKSAPLSLYYVGLAQINAVAPQNAATGMATFTISTSSDLTGCSTPSTAVPEKASVMLASVAPGLFSANSTGKGVAWGYWLFNLASGSAPEPVFTCPAAGPCVAAPVDVSSGSSALVLYATGIRNRASLAGVTVTVGSQMLPAYYAGLAPGSAGLYGLDQINVALPASLAGSGTTFVSVTIGGATSNQVTIDIQ